MEDKRILQMSYLDLEDITLKKQFQSYLIPKSEEETLTLEERYERWIDVIDQ
ncbi:MAG: hypothetical protein JW904_04985 [Spirochaetales bacterium]|nr:hypothetical protein [Spirochaetales bacterium]